MAKTEGRKAGRIDSVDAAREALQIPTNQLSIGVPAAASFEVRLVDEPSEPEIVADFAHAFLTNSEGRLHNRGRDRISRRQLRNRWWLVFGPIVEASDRSLVLGGLTVAPAAPAGLVQDSEAFRGVNATVLRLLSPTRLLAEAVEILRRRDYLLDRIGADVSPRQRRAQSRITAGRAPQSRITDEELELIARRYVTLYRRGVRKGLLAQLGGEFGLTVAQTRDRVHRARQVGFLMKSKQGRPSADPGPRLQESTLWQPTESKGETSG